SCSVDQPAFPTVVGRVLLGFAFLVMLSAGAMAQNTFLYTNNNASGANTVSAFSVGSNGALTPVAGSPFPTGGTGSGGGFPAINQVAISTARKFLYASNSFSADISGFSINPVTGFLTLVPGSPFPAGGIGDLSLAVSQDDKFLFCGTASG